MKEERRLVWRVLRQWKEIADVGRLPRRDEIYPWLQGEDGANGLLIAVESSIELSHFVVVGVNLAGSSLFHRHARRCAPVECTAGGLVAPRPHDRGVATLREVGICYRAVLLPLSEGGSTIDHVLGATNYRSLRTNETRTTQVNFRRLPKSSRLERYSR